MNLSRTRLRDWLNPVKWVSFCYSLVVSLFMPRHRLEQVVLRMSECGDCLKYGSCKHCGCTTYLKMVVPWEEDSVDPQSDTDQPRWGKMLNKDDWEHMKQQYNIQLQIKMDNHGNFQEE